MSCDEDMASNVDLDNLEGERTKEADPIYLPLGPITRACARRLKGALN